MTIQAQRSHRAEQCAQSATHDPVRVRALGGQHLGNAYRGIASHAAAARRQSQARPRIGFNRHRVSPWQNHKTRPMLRRALS